MNLTDPDKIDTIEKARDLSLIKWENVNSKAQELYELIGNSCGFCWLGEHLSERRFRCDHCGVKPRCNKMQSDASEIEETLREFIEGTLDFLRNMEVSEK